MGLFKRAELRLSARVPNLELQERVSNILNDLGFKKHGMIGDSQLLFIERVGLLKNALEVSADFGHVGQDGFARMQFGLNIFYAIGFKVLSLPDRRRHGRLIEAFIARIRSDPDIRIIDQK